MLTKVYKDVDRINVALERTNVMDFCGHGNATSGSVTYEDRRLSKETSVLRTAYNGQLTN